MCVGVLHSRGPQGPSPWWKGGRAEEGAQRGKAASGGGARGRGGADPGFEGERGWEQGHTLLWGVRKQVVLALPRPHCETLGEALALHISILSQMPKHHVPPSAPHGDRRGRRQLSVAGLALGMEGASRKQNPPQPCLSPPPTPRAPSSPQAPRRTRRTRAAAERTWAGSSSASATTSRSPRSP